MLSQVIYAIMQVDYISLPVACFLRMIGGYDGMNWKINGGLNLEFGNGFCAVLEVSIVMMSHFSLF